MLFYSAFYRLLLFISLGLYLTGCTKQVEVVGSLTFPDAPATLAVFCLLTPQDSVFATVTTLRSVSDRLPRNQKGLADYVRVPDATVILQEKSSSRKITLTYLGRNGLYGAKLIDFKIISGQDYSLQVIRPGFQLLFAECQVPTKAASIESFAYGGSFNGGGINRRRVEVRWQDVSTKTDSLNYFVANKYRFIPPFDTASNIYYSQYISKVGPTYFYENDAFDNSYPQYYYLFTVSRDTFRFYHMAEKMDDITRHGPDFFGAFQGIVPEYTNIKGGYGIFGAYLSSRITVTFK